MSRQTRILVLAGVGVVAIVVVVLAISLGSGDDEENGTPTTTNGEVVSIVDGIAQEGELLGRADAPLVVEEYADLQCPFCAQFARDVLPTIVDEYVKTGRVRMRLRLLSFLGDDSVRGARAAYAASLQNFMWQFAEGFFANQGPENSGYATDDFLRETAEGIPGLDVERLFSERDDADVTRLMEAVDRDAERRQVDATPAFFSGPRGGSLQPLEVSSLDVESFRAALDAALAAAE